MKKILAVILMVSVCFLLFVGCSDNGDTENAESNDGIVKLTGIIIKHALTKPLEEMEWLQEAEARAGVDIEWEEVTADWEQKKGAMLAAGDIPDLIVGPEAITDADFTIFLGLFQDMTQLIDDYAPNVKAMFDAKPDTKVISTQLNGEIYGLAKYQRYWPETVNRQYINQVWLDNLGLEVPTTWDELYDVLLAFKEQDANGNGDPNDEIPMDFAPIGTTGFGYFQPTALMGSLGITLTDVSVDGLFVEDEVVKNFLVDDRYKQYIQFMNKLWSAGLINPEAFTQDYTKYKSVARGDGDSAKVGFSWAWEVTGGFGNQLAPQYISIPVLKASADSSTQVSWSYDNNVLNYGRNFIQMSAATENKEAAMKFINELYDPKVSMQVLFGSLGPNIKENGDGSYTVLPPADEAMDPGTWKWTSTWADNGPMYIADSLDLTLPADLQSVAEQTEPLQEVLNAIDKKQDVLPRMFMKFSEEDNNTMKLNETESMNLALSKFAQWITSGGIEEEWDAYVEELNKLGITENIQIMQKYYDEYSNQ